MKHYTMLYGMNRPILNINDFQAIKGIRSKKGGRIKEQLITPRDIIPQMNISNGILNNVASPILGALATAVLPALTTFIIKKFIDNDSKQDIPPEVSNIIEVDKEYKEDSIDDDTDDDIDDDTRSLLNRIVGRGIMEI
jgi:hypothetical protein